jgi:branched-chain amino acid transport system permease protein
MPERAGRLSVRGYVLGGAGAIILVLATFVPLVHSQYQLLNDTRFLLLALMAQGWNLIGGYTGYPAFGNVGFFGLGAYGTGLLMLSRWHVPFFPAMAFAALLAAVVAALLGFALLRLRGHYFAIATLGVAEALREVADSWDSLTEGSTGIDLPIRSDGQFFYYTALVLVVVGLVVTVLLARSKIGYSWMAIREDHDAARMMGIDTTRRKVLAFALSAVFAAAAGALTAYQNTHVTPTDFFKIDYTLQMIIACVIGGVGTAFGPILGAAIYQLLSTYAWSHFIELHPSVTGGIIVFFVLFAPRGLMPIVRDLGRGRGGPRRSFWQALLANVRAHRVT